MNRLLRDVVRGAIAGTAATWAMTKVTGRLYKAEDEAARRRENRARHHRPANVVAAEKVARLVGKKRLSRRERRRYGNAVHWATGIGAGVAYAVARPRMDGMRAGGLGFGTAFWLLLDEAATPLLGLAPGPKKFPWQTHARGLAGHLTYGAVADATLRVLQRS